MNVCFIGIFLYKLCYNKNDCIQSVNLNFKVKNISFTNDIMVLGRDFYETYT